MNTSPASITYRRLKAPAASGQALVVPPWDDVPALLMENRIAAAASEAVIFGIPLTQLASAARGELVKNALAYTKQYRPDVDVEDATEIILSGHQPQLFHAGVWFKNFALHQLSQSPGRVGIHLLIDNDLARSPFLGIPTGTIDQPRTEMLAYDVAGDPVPFEERSIQSLEQFRSFGTSAFELIQPLVPNSSVNELWQHANDATGRTMNLGQCLSQARHVAEGKLGLQTLELPLSQIADGREFFKFAMHVCVNIREFSEIYNGAVQEYRDVHKLRSNSHPVPKLARPSESEPKNAGWHEAPFWIWRKRSP